MVETKENILDELTAKLGTLEALLDSLERNKAQRSPLPFTVGLPTPSTSDISSSSDFSTSSSKSRPHSPEEEEEELASSLCDVHFSSAQASSDLYERDSLESSSLSSRSSSTSSFLSSSPLISESALIEEISHSINENDSSPSHGPHSGTNETSPVLRQRAALSTSPQNRNIKSSNIRTRIELAPSNSSNSTLTSSANKLVQKCDATSQKLRGFYEERKELDRNMEEIFQRLSFWTSLEKSNRYLILKEVENALALFELHHQDQELALPKIEITRDQQSIDASSSSNSAATLNPDTNSSSSNHYSNSTCSHQTVSWLYFIIACLLLFILFTGIDFHCPYQIV